MYSSFCRRNAGISYAFLITCSENACASECRNRNANVMLMQECSQLNQLCLPLIIPYEIVGLLSSSHIIAFLIYFFFNNKPF
jgi:hypothetical protein